MSIDFLPQLEAIVRDRLDASDVTASYTARLADAGMPRVAQKIGEEGVEVALAAATAASDEALLGECADLVYHLLVLLALRGLSLDAVGAKLAERHDPASVDS